MSVLNFKDSVLMEEIRYFEESDKVFHSVLNRPIEDLVERTRDIRKIFAPNFGLRVRQTTPASDDVVVVAGSYVPNDTDQVYYPSSGVSAPITITACAAGNIRIDLIAFDTGSGLPVNIKGDETPAATTYATLWTNGNTGAAPHRAILTADYNYGTLVPLAYLYVNDAPADFDEDIAVNTAGCIRDCRLAWGGEIQTFETSGAGIKKDVLGGSYGTTTLATRADHRHNVNVTGGVGAVPMGPSPAVVASAGADTVYARNDHDHLVAVSSDWNHILPDTLLGDPGNPAADEFARADHRHLYNVTATLPATVSPLLAATPGVSNYYSRRHHVHAVSGCGVYSAYPSATSKFVWAFSAAAQTTVPIGTPLFAFVTACWHHTAVSAFGGHCSGWIYKSGVTIYQASASISEQYNVDTADGCATIDTTHCFGWGAGPPGYRWGGIFLVTCTQFDAAGITLVPNAASTDALKILLVYFYQS